MEMYINVYNEVVFLRKQIFGDTHFPERKKKKLTFFHHIANKVLTLVYGFLPPGLYLAILRKYFL